MRAISLHQPFATAVVIDAKRYETRSWWTAYRGPLVIHAAKHCLLSQMGEFGAMWNWNAALNRMPGSEPLSRTLPFGALIGIVDLVDCVRCENVPMDIIMGKRQQPGNTDVLLQWWEGSMGYWGAGRFAWKLENPRQFVTPVEWKGTQKFFNVPDTMKKLPTVEAAAV